MIKVSLGGNELCRCIDVQKACACVCVGSEMVHMCLKVPVIPVLHEKNDCLLSPVPPIN